MIITCPQCATRYRFEPQKPLKDRQTVRCARCHHSWFCFAPESEQRGPELSSAERSLPSSDNGQRASHAIISRLPEIAHRLRVAPAPTWALLFVAAVASVWSAAQFTTGELGQLSLDRVGYSIEMNAGRQILRVHGTVLNSSSRDLSLPKVEAVLMDAKGREVDRWQFEVPVHRLAPHGETRFLTERANLPVSGGTLVLSLAKRPLSR